MGRHKHLLQKKILALFLCAVLIMGMNPIQIKAMNQVTIRYQVPLKGYLYDERPDLDVRFQAYVEKNDSTNSLRLDPKNPDSGITTEWDSEEKIMTYTYTCDSGAYKEFRISLSILNGLGGTGHVINLATGEDYNHPTITQNNPEILTIHLMSDKNTLYQNYFAIKDRHGLYKVTPPTKENCTFVRWETAYHSTFNPDHNYGSTITQPMVLYAVWRGSDGEILSSPEAPTASKDSGNYDESFDVELTAEDGCEIYYTTDGSKPTTESPKYNGAITVTGTPGESTKTTIRAIAVKDGMSSEIAEYEYTLHIPSPSHNHSWNPAWSKDDEAHWHECDTPDCPITRDSEKNGYAAHTEDSGTVTTEPTTESEGVKTYKCTECGHIIRTEVIDKLTTTPTPVPTASPTPVPTASPTPPPSHVHNYGTEWKADDDKHWHECVCGSKSEEGFHTEDNGTVTKEPTVDAEGTKVYKCSVCGTVMRTEILEKLEPRQTYEDDDTDDDEDDDDSNGTKKSTQDKNSGDGGAPETGDASHVEIYATVAMIAGLSYLLLYFINDGHGMTETKKKELIAWLIAWAGKGSGCRKYTAIVLIFLLLVYYHSIGKRIAVDWKKLYD